MLSHRHDDQGHPDLKPETAVPPMSRRRPRAPQGSAPAQRGAEATPMHGGSGWAPLPSRQTNRSHPRKQGKVLKQEFIPSAHSGYVQ